MRRKSKIAAVAGALLLVVLIPLLLLVTAPMVYAGLVRWFVSSTSGADVDYADMSVALFPLHVSVADLTLRNPDFAQPLLTADSVAGTARLGGYFDGAATWWSATGSGVEVRLEEDARGNSNWVLDPDQPPGEGGVPAAAFDFSRLQFTDVTVTRVVDETHRLELSRLDLEQSGDERLRIDLSGDYRQRPLRAEGTLALPSSERAQEVRFDADVFGGSIRVDGTVGHDGISPGRAEVSVQIDDLAPVGRLLDVDLGTLEPISLAGTLETPQPGHWNLDLYGRLAEKAALVASEVAIDGNRYHVRRARLGYGASLISGEGTLDVGARMLRARLEAPGLNLSELTALAPAGAGDAEPAAPLRIPDSLRTWSYDVEAEIAELDHRNLQAQDLTLTLREEEGDAVLVGTAQALQVRAADGPIARIVEPVSLRGEIAFPKTADAAGRVMLGLETRGLEAEASGELPANAGAQPSLRLRGELSSLAAVEGLHRPTFDDLLPLTADVTTFNEDGLWRIDVQELGAADSALRGRLSVHPAAEPMAVSGTLSSRRLDLNSIPTTARLGGEAEQDAEQHDADDADGDVISDAPVDWSWLQQAALDVALQVERLDFNRTSFRNVRTRVALADGRLRVDPLDAELDRGGVRGHVEVAGQDQGVRIDGYLAVAQLVPADLGEPHAGFIDGGETDLVLDLRAEGRSLQELAGSLDGQIAMEVQNATIRNSLFEELTADLLVQTLRMINPFIEQDPQTELECAAAHFLAQDGVLTSPNRLILETSKVVVRAGGTIDLGEETLTVDFVPSPREGLGISLAGLAELVRIGGTLGDLQAQADPSAILKGGATIGAAIATGGLSLLAQGLFARARNEGTRCGEIFEEQTDVPEPIQVDEE